MKWRKFGLVTGSSRGLGRGCRAGLGRVYVLATARYTRLYDLPVATVTRSSLPPPPLHPRPPLALAVTDESAVASAVKAAIGAFADGAFYHNAGYGQYLVREERDVGFSRTNRTRILRGRHREEGALPYFRQKEKAGNFVRFRLGGQDRASQAWALFGCEMGCRGFSEVLSREGHR